MFKYDGLRLGYGATRSVLIINKDFMPFTLLHI